MTGGESRTGLSVARLEALADGIFGFAMTLLVLNLIIPDVAKSEAAVRIPAILRDDWMKFLNYAISFVLLAMFWMVHHEQTRLAKRTDTVHAWINIFILMFVALVPFSFSLMSDYPFLRVTNLVFQGNLLTLGLLFAANFYYVTKGARLLDPDAGDDRVAAHRERSLTIPALSLAAMLLTFVSPEWSNVVYLLAPVLEFKGGRRKPARSAPPPAP